jgi:hypothetical protein
MALSKLGVLKPKLHACSENRGKWSSLEAKEATLKSPEIRRKVVSWAPVAHAYNPSYSGGRDQKDYSVMPVQGNNL